MPTTLTPQDFVLKWRHAALKEISAYSEHFIDLCRLIGHPTPGELDPKGAFFTFQAGADKTDGGHGFADVWYRGRFAWEYKGPHANLDKAYRQLLQYREALENPPLLVVCDLEQIVIHTNFTNSVKRAYPLALEDLLKPEGLALLRSVFFNPEALKAVVTSEQVTQQAAAHFSRLAELLRKYGEDPGQIAHFLIRLLFCLFAEDVDLLPDKLFSQLVKKTRTRPGAFQAQLGQLFAAMSGGGWFGSQEIPHFDGRLFDDAQALPLDSDGLEILAEVCDLDWGSIEPSIFGTLFERSLDPSKRSQLGAHYTGKDDILLIVEPVLMAPLRRRWDEVQAQARSLAVRVDQAAKGQRSKLASQLKTLLTGFAGEIAAVQVLDPACGSGNFLYVALRQLLDLEKEVIQLSAELGVGGFFPAVGPAQLHGIEINEYAHQLAQATIQIGYIQWLRDNGYGFPAEPILKPLDNILHMDAILAFDGTGRPYEPEWPKVDVIIGNPPFLGDKKMRSEMGDLYVRELRSLYESRLSGQSDLVCYWFDKACTMLEKGRVLRVGLLATNSIRMGENRRVLDRVRRIGNIFYAWSDRPWILDGAAVRVSIVGFDNASEKKFKLDNQIVSQINSDLTSTIDVTPARKLEENSSICFLGMMKAGPFDIDEETAYAMLQAPLNPNGRPNSEVVKPRIGGQDVVGRARNIWIIDFVDMPMEIAALYEQPFAYIQRNVKPFRDNNRDQFLRTKWWLHGRSRPELRKALQGLSRCIITPEVSKHRVFNWMPTSILPDHKLHVIAREDDYFLGVLQSRIHELWSLAQCSWIGAGNDPSYSSSRTFETYPFPWPPGREPQDDPRVQAIASAALELVRLRDNWLNPPGLPAAELKKRTLTNLYNQRPAWLDLAHRALDRAVFAAYGWPDTLSDEDLLARLLALNLQRSQA